MNAREDKSWNLMLKGEIQSLGGKARAKKLSATERSDIARMGAAARWKNGKAKRRARAA